MTATADFEFQGKQVHFVSDGLWMLGSILRHFARCHLESEWYAELMLPSTKVIVDAGANMGQLSLMYALLRPDAEVIAFEPSSYNWPYLRVNTKDAANIRSHKLAVGDCRKLATLAVPTTAQKTFLNFGDMLNPGQFSLWGESDRMREVAQVVKLDDVVSRADWIKMDVEGYEWNALHGAERLLKECRPYLQLELIPANIRMASIGIEGFLGYLETLNYIPVKTLGVDVMFAPRERVHIPMKRLLCTERTNSYKFEWEEPCYTSPS